MEEQTIFARDEIVLIKTITGIFVNDKCSGLCGKPKVFCFQSCRGRSIDKGVDIIWDDYVSQQRQYLDINAAKEGQPMDTDSRFSTTDDERTENHEPMEVKGNDEIDGGSQGDSRVQEQKVLQRTTRLPNEADILLAYSTVDGYESIRETSRGSAYIQTLCEVMKDNLLRWRNSKGQQDHFTDLLTKINHKVANYDWLPTRNFKLQMPDFSSRLTKKFYLLPVSEKITSMTQGRMVASSSMTENVEGGAEPLPAG
ncbi:caspase-3-like [Paramacrobiotus metropolitanus]|uniref:caspase-3-like n=1 Tax=Paramacrobiotus metropolitanus TaxID=2943436 RepID=UPI0024465657|nr:caspase-3-like [Paramacrobiotus metropolitanus]